MKNKQLKVIKILNEQLLNYPSTKKITKYLRVIVNEQLKACTVFENESFKPEKLSRVKIYEKAIGEKVSSDVAKRRIRISKLEEELENLINNHPDCKREYEEIGYIPIIEICTSEGGPKNEKLLWINIKELKKSDINENLIEDNFDKKNNCFQIKYERSKINIKGSLFSKIFLKEGKLVMRSVKGIFLMLLLMINFAFDIFLLIYSILIFIVIRDLPNIHLWEAILFGAFILYVYLHWKYLFLPLHQLPLNRVVKDPHLMAGINVDNADLELFKNSDGDNVLHLTQFTATCPICTGEIILANGKPDQTQPLVGRCKEAPHAHVYSFDRVMLTGYFLGVDGYLQDDKKSLI